MLKTFKFLLILIIWILEFVSILMIITLAKIALEKVLLSTSFAPVSHTCCLLVYAFPGNLYPQISH